MADNTVALGIKVPDAMASLGSVMGAANAMQSFKSGAVDLEKKRATLQSDIERNAAETSRAKTAAEGEGADLTEKQAFRALGKNGFKEYMGQDGQMDFNKLLPAVMQAAPTKGAEFMNQIYGAHSAAVNAQKALLGLNNEQRATAASAIASVGDHPAEAKKTLDALVEQIPQLRPAVESAWKYHLSDKQKDPAAFKETAQMLSKGVMSVQAQNQVNTPGGASFDNGQQAGVVNTNPMAGPMGPVAGTVVQKQLPPTTPDYDPNTQTPGLVGPQPGTSPVPLVGPGMTPATVTPGARIPAPVQQSRDGDALKILQEERARTTNPVDAAALDREIAARTKTTPVTQQFAQRRVQTGPALGESENVGGTVAINNKDFAETQEAAGKATGNIANLQKIKEYAKGATVGAGADRRALVNGIGDLLGIPAGELNKTNTDLLAKHANMLALTGGNTDSARALAEAANPNIHMNETAIRKAADYIIALQKTAVEKQKFLQPFKAMRDPNQYQSALKEWNANADPRVLQLMEMSPKEKAEMVKSMSDSEYADFKRKALRLHEMGVGK